MKLQRFLLAPTLLTPTLLVPVLFVALNASASEVAHAQTPAQTPVLTATSDAAMPDAAKNDVSSTQSVAATPTPSPAAPTPPDETGERMREVTKSYNSGLAAIRAKKLPEAATFLERAVQLSPDDAMSQMLLGYTYLLQNRTSEALKTLQSAEALNAQLDAHSHAQVQNYLGLAQWNNNEYSNSLHSYNRAVELDPDYADARYNLAFALLARGQENTAIPHFAKLLLASPKDATLYDGLGQAYEGSANWPKAIENYRRAIALDAKNFAYPLHLGLVLVRSDPTGSVKGRRESAVGFLRQALQLNPKAAAAHLQIGLIFLQMKRWADAQKSLQQYVALQPKDSVGVFNLALSYDYGARFNEALKTYAQAAALQPNDASIRNNVGRIYLKRNDLEDAIAQFQQALTLDANSVDARNNLALALTQKEDFPNAAKQWRSLIDIAARQMRALPPLNSPTERPGDKTKRVELSARLAAARAALAENYLKSGAYSDAAQQYRDLLKQNPTNTAAQINLGLALYNTREYASALAAYDALLKREPKNAVAQNNRGVVLEAMKNKAAALTAYKRAIELQPDYTDAKNNRDRLLATTVIG